MNQASDKLINIPEGVFIEGFFKTIHSIKIESNFSGTLLSKDKVILETNSNFNGDLICSDLIISGKLTGNIFCTGKVHVKQNSEINGNIYTKRFENDDSTNLNCIINIPNYEIISFIEAVILNININEKLSTDSELEIITKTFKDKIIDKSNIELNKKLENSVEELENSVEELENPVIQNIPADINDIDTRISVKNIYKNR